MQSNPPPTSFEAYPFGKLLPIIDQTSDFLAIKPFNWFNNWLHVRNSDTLDPNSLLALTILLNQWRDAEIFYQIKPSELAFHTKKSYAPIFIHVLGMFTRTNHDFNHTVECTLTEILNFYYGKFETIELFVQFGQILDGIIFHAQRFILIERTKQDKENINQLFTIPEIHFMMNLLGNLVDFIGNYDKINSPVPTNGVPTREISQAITQTFKSVLQQRLLPQLFSAFIYIKIDFLVFFELHYEKEWEDYQSRTQTTREAEQANKKRRIDDILSRNADIMDPNILGLLKNQQEHKGVLVVPLMQIREYLKSIAKNLMTQTSFFAYLSPLLRYFPHLVTCSRSEDQKNQIYEKIVIPTMQVLSTIFEDKRVNLLSGSRKLSELNQMDLVRAFRSSTFLQDLEISLVATFEDKIQEIKEKSDEENQEVFHYFKVIAGFKNKIIKALENLSKDFEIELHFTPLEEPKNIQKDIKRGLNQLVSRNYQLKADTNQTISVNIRREWRKNEELENPGGKKRGPKPKDKKISHEKSRMLNVNEAETTDPGEQMMEMNFRQGKGEIKQTKRRKNKKSSDFNEHQDSEGNSNSLKFEPLQKKGRSVSPGINPSNKMTGRTNVSPNYRMGASNQRQSKSLQKKIQPQKQANIFKVLRKDEVEAFYRLKSNSYNARRIFKELKTELRMPKKNSPHFFYEHYTQRFPSFITTEGFWREEVQVFQANYERLKLKPGKQICSPREKEHKARLKLTFDMNHPVNYEIQRINYELLGRRKVTAELKERMLRVINDKKMIDKKRKENHKFYVNEIITLEKLTEVKISLFPFVKSDYGRQSIRNLFEMVQNFMKIVRLVMPQEEQFQTNVFNKSLWSLKEMLCLNTRNFDSRRMHELFLSLLFELITWLNASQSIMKEFYGQFFKILPAYLQSMLLFYMFEVEKRRKWEESLMTREILMEYMTNKEWVGLLEFMLKQARLGGVEMSHMYEKMYPMLGERCVRMVFDVQRILCREIISIVKSKSREVQHIIRPENYQKLQALKKQYHEEFSTMIDLLNMFLRLSYSSMEFEPNMPSRTRLGKGVTQYVYFCNRCGGPQLITFSDKKSSNYQDIMCQICPNTTVNRFQLARSQDFFYLQLDLTLDLKDLLKNCAIRMRNFVKEYEWDVDAIYLLQMKPWLVNGENQREDMEFTSCDEEFDASTNQRSESDDNQHQQTGNENKKRTQNQSRTQNQKKTQNQNRNQNSTQNQNNNNNSNHNNNNKKQNKKKKKSDVELYQDDNEEFCFNSLQLLCCYFEDLTKTMDHAFNI